MNFLNWWRWVMIIIRKDWLKGADKLLLSEKDLKKIGCGPSDSVVEANSGVTVLRWFEDVTLRCPAGTVMVERRARIINMERPAMEVKKNIHMGRVDFFDMLLSMYQIRHRSTKYYTHIIFHCIGMAVVNGWLLYGRHMSQKRFP